MYARYGNDPLLWSFQVTGGYAVQAESPTTWVGATWILNEKTDIPEMK
jgi:hypothetical protein